MSTVTSEHTVHENVIPHLETSPIHIKGILAATDLSEQARLGLKFGARLAKQLHSRFHVLYTVMPQLYVADTAVLSAELQKIEVERGEKRLHQHLSRIPEVRIIKHEEIAMCGPAPEAIAAIVDVKGIDLVVMGSHGRSGLGKIALGSVAEAVIRSTHCPALVVGPHCTRRFDPLKSMILATTLPAGSLRAAQYAMSLAKETGATLTVVHVVPDRVQTMGVFGVNVKERALGDLRQLMPNDPELRKRVNFEVVCGEPAEEIVAAARRLKASLVVMGVKEHSIMAEHAPWTKLSAVIREAPCPVLAIQPHLV